MNAPEPGHMTHTRVSVNPKLSDAPIDYMRDQVVGPSREQYTRKAIVPNAATTAHRRHNGYNNSTAPS